jgi:ABC-type polysaccharide/polyol phosphate transport system ATPase subunit
LVGGFLAERPAILLTVFEPSTERDVVFQSDGRVVLENVSVLYHLPRERIQTFKEYAIRMIQNRLEYVDFWALQNVSLSLRKGESLGVIGVNGSGKSTLLKVISRVLKPTKGRVWIRGRVAPLLELGAGFHFDLTGRENIFLNGALLGFSRQEMEEKLDAIIDFSELSEFIDAPLRTYSSGMVARLGFTIATDISPNILLVDEVLSVGDVDFVSKSERRMQEFRATGVSMILVSHSLSQIESLCDRVIWLDHGKVMAEGLPAEVIQAYINRK